MLECGPLRVGGGGDQPPRARGILLLLLLLLLYVLLSGVAMSCFLPFAGGGWMWFRQMDAFSFALRWGRVGESRTLLVVRYAVQSSEAEAVVVLRSLGIWSRWSVGRY